MIIQTSEDYKKIHGGMQLCIFGLLVTASEMPKRRKKIEEFLTKDTHILSAKIYERLFEFTEKNKPQDYNTFLTNIKKKIVINSSSIEELEKKSEELLAFTKKTIPSSQKALRKLCNVEY